MKDPSLGEGKTGWLALGGGDSVYREVPVMYSNSVTMSSKMYLYG